VNVLSGVILAGSLLYGIIFSIRIGGADMPITISLLNSLSGLAAAIAGFAVRDPLLIATGAIVGSAGLILTRIMCRAMNRSLTEILLGKTTAGPVTPRMDVTGGEVPSSMPAETERRLSDTRESAVEWLREAKTVIIIPGYGMALSQAQHMVKTLLDHLENRGKDVRFAIHPVAGRMPGHMNVLLAEADVPYEMLEEMEAINPRFAETDAVIIVGANDVVNPAANTAQGTPIYGMPILNAAEAKFVLIFNKDTRPGYSGVENPLYNRENVALFLGDAAEKIGELMEKLGSEV
jgi:NAD(P) transhydrogenase subunit beta